ncbi:hypothetical protein EFK50_07700 [Nocardioides marmoriginsengisoli]|uniref:Uncharacterized protein n=1 Tax=Nocardioides marmoriginsengisoli TaxID=661483 RepID=A0A3N0CM54_9ACTN|nr:hypothetical protein [Nocardioides marmoriginsengisoli]RNL64399.1 hypothetical protein EFK50_07700 [Nocardioides marmoriginsengisoli]
MHIFTSHRGDTKRYFAHFDLPTHPLCWLRGHRAKAEVIDTKYSGSWVLVTCRTCGIRHSDPYLNRGRMDKVDRKRAQEEVARQVDAARHNNSNYARVRDGRDGYGHHRVELALEINPQSYRKPGIHLHIGDKWSETPLDGSLHGRNRSAYFSVGGIGNRLADRITKGEKRDITVGATYKEGI